MTDERDDLDRLFDEARGDGGEAMVPDALMAQIMADAATHMPRPADQIATLPAKGIGAILLAALGGWTAVSGLAAATVAGLWLGISPPDALDSLLSGDSVSVSLYPEFTALGGEG